MKTLNELCELGEKFTLTVVSGLCLILALWELYL